MSTPPDTGDRDGQVWDALVLGAGAAGLTAAMQLARHGRRAAIVDGFTGNHMMNAATVENFPGFADGILGADLWAALQGQALAAGAELLPGTVERVELDGGTFTVTTDSGAHPARAVLACTGSSLRRLGVEGEEGFAGRGLSECATCDGPLFQGQPVAVVGGGDSALDEVLALTEWASEVALVYTGAEPTAQQALRDRVGELQRVRVHADTEVVALQGEDNLSGVVLRNGVGVQSVADVAGLFVFVGLVPNTAFLEGLVELDGDGRVAVDPWMATSVPGLFAAGDIRRDSASLFVSAAGDGATAAVATHRFLG
jgi:thioredoxin reductase (NADPH)